MNVSPPDFVTVDMRGLKAALVDFAKAKRTSVSVVVRDAVARELGDVAGHAAGQPHAPGPGPCSDRWVKLSIRVTQAEAERIDAGAGAARLSRGAYLVGLANGVPVLTSGGSRAEMIMSLVASCAELSTLSRNVHQFMALPQEGNVQRALEYRGTLDSLAGDVRKHLMLCPLPDASQGCVEPP
ncbi:hypothetical protein [Roseateles saccharophilus]|uniref:Uncharacterized protein n=1 Tax=Roseateles saccharophilus TaxID=304 RepID=A0A4R3VLJ2_ROSSA|nr:hypothetical protein [Roseateles saccharophilus]MDG0832523.1 hypothetical protein [Roseateles saccharophilus]TCV03985.1 hypothetical protein EV671_1002255 [Roseateles saccharophilus]